MKSIITLLRLKQREMDALKRQQALLENQREEIRGRINRLSDQLQAEMDSARKMPDMAGFFGDFSVTIKKRQEQMYIHIRKLEVELDKLAGQIHERFSEMKKYDIALANWKKRQKETADRRAQQYMDEIALRGYIRRDVQ